MIINRGVEEKTVEEETAVVNEAIEILSQAYEENINRELDDQNDEITIWDQQAQFYKSIFESFLLGQAWVTSSLEKKQKVYSFLMDSSRSQRLEVLSAETHKDVLNIMSKRGLHRFVKEYHSFLKWRQDNLDNHESPGIILQSLQSWVLFLLDNAVSQITPYTDLDVDFDGCVELTWKLSPEPLPGDPDNKYYGNGWGMISITFFPSHLNHIFVSSGTYGSNKRRIVFDGFFSHAKTMQIMQLFKERFLHE